MPVTPLGPLALETHYLSARTEDETAELEILYTRMNEYLTANWDDDVTVYEFNVESEKFSLYPERMINFIVADCGAAGWDEVTVETVVIPTVTESRQFRGLYIKLEYTP